MTRLLRPELIFPAVLLLILVGCTQSSNINNGMTRSGAPRPSKESIGLARLCNDLGLQIVEQSRFHATLRNSSNMVMIYPDPNGQVYVNGRVIAAGGGIFVEEGEIFVPSAVEAQIRSSLRPAQYVQPIAVAPAVKPAVIAPQPVAAVGRVSGEIIIDPGHGGKDPGASSLHGGVEKFIVLDVSTNVFRNLQRSGVTAEMTRSDDTFVELNDRPVRANQMRADAFVAIHADHAPRASANGFTVYVPPSASPRNMALAAAIERNMVAAGFTSNGIKAKGYRVLVRSDVPAVLIELGYLSNPTESAALNDASYRRMYAKAISNGIVQYLQGKRQ